MFSTERDGYNFAILVPGVSKQPRLRQLSSVDLTLTTDLELVQPPWSFFAPSSPSLFQGARSDPGFSFRTPAKGKRGFVLPGRIPASLSVVQVPQYGLYKSLKVFSLPFSGRCAFRGRS